MEEIRKRLIEILVLLRSLRYLLIEKHIDAELTISEMIEQIAYVRGHLDSVDLDPSLRSG